MEENTLIKVSAKGLRNKMEGDVFIVVVLKVNLKREIRYRNFEHRGKNSYHLTFTFLLRS